jgi:hypothetical protein
MEAEKRKEIEDQEKQEFIEQWKLKNKMKGKKPYKKKIGKEEGKK